MPLLSSCTHIHTYKQNNMSYKDALLNGDTITSQALWNMPKENYLCVWMKGGHLFILCPSHKHQPRFLLHFSSEVIDTQASAKGITVWLTVGMQEQVGQDRVTWAACQGCPHRKEPRGRVGGDQKVVTQLAGAAELLVSPSETQRRLGEKTEKGRGRNSFLPSSIFHLALLQIMDQHGTW